MGSIWLDIDEDALADAKRELGTSTINVALRRAGARRRDHVKGQLDVLARADLAPREQAWRQRTRRHQHVNRRTVAEAHARVRALPIAKALVTTAPLRRPATAGASRAGSLPVLHDARACAERWTAHVVA